MHSLHTCGPATANTKGTLRRRQALPVNELLRGAEAELSA